MVCGYSESSRRGATISVLILSGAITTLLLAYISFGESNKLEDVKSLMMAAIIFRHGDRNPTGSYPNDPHINYKWYGGFGALSANGSNDMYKLGKQLRLRYSDLFPSNGLYTADEVYVQSSKYERCLMSASSFLAGFMPPPENRNPLPIPWQPIPINYESREKDILIIQKAVCPLYDKLLENFYKPDNEVLRSINEKNKDLYDFLTKETGKNISTIRNVELLFNTLQIEENNGLELPNWTRTVYPNRMLQLAQRNLKLLTETNIMKKIKAGPLLTTIYDNMVKKRENSLTPNRKLFLYSGHDVTLVNIMNSLQILEQTSEKPDFGATLGFELHSRDSNEDLEVKIVYYYNHNNNLAKDISIPNCDAPCSLNQFGKSIDQLINRDYQAICNDESQNIN